MGEVQVLRMDTVTQNIEILKNIGSLIETPVFYEHLSATENLEIHLDYMGIENIDIETVLSKVGLPKTGKQAVSKFSLGMRQRLAIARAMIHKPKLLILDETINVDSVNEVYIQRAISSISVGRKQSSSGCFMEELNFTVDCMLIIIFTCQF